MTDSEILALARECGNFKYSVTWPDFRKDILTFARSLLAKAAEGREAVAWMRKWAFENRKPVYGEGAKLREVTKHKCLATDVPLFAAQAAAVPEAMEHGPFDSRDETAHKRGWNACRAAMLAASPAPPAATQPKEKGL